MKRFFKWLGVIALVTAIAFSFSGCNKDSLDKTTWTAHFQGEKVLLRFNNPNFNISVGGHTLFEGSYSISDGIITMTSEGTESAVFTGTVSGNKLTLINDLDVVFIEFTKQHRIFGS